MREKLGGGERGKLGFWEFLYANEVKDSFGHCFYIKNSLVGRGISKFDDVVITWTNQKAPFHSINIKNPPLFPLRSPPP